MDAIDPLVVYDRRGNKTEALRDLWKDRAAFFVGGGPSLKSLDYMRLADRGVLSLGLNNVAGFVPVRAFTFNDPPEKFHHGIWRDGSIMKFLPRPKLTHKKRGRLREKFSDGSFKYLEEKTTDCPNVWGYDRCDWYTPETFLTEPGASLGNNAKGVEKTGRAKIICSMFLGLRLLHYLGVNRVYLLGVDFHMDPAKGAAGQGNYAFGETRDAGAIDSNNGLYTVAAAMLTELRPVFEAAKFGVWNCNQYSALRAFDYVPFEEALADCRNGVPAEPFDLNGWYVKGEQPAKQPDPPIAGPTAHGLSEASPDAEPTARPAAA